MSQTKDDEIAGSYEGSFSGNHRIIIFTITIFLGIFSRCYVMRILCFVSMDLSETGYAEGKDEWGHGFDEDIEEAVEEVDSEEDEAKETEIVSVTREEGCNIEEAPLKSS